MPIPGTRSTTRLDENYRALVVALTEADLREMQAAFASLIVYGESMDAGNMAFERR